MPVNKESYSSLKVQLDASDVRLVAVSKTKPVEDIRELYELGHRDFGENYVQELLEKEQQLPKDIRWHFIGHLQSNKAKYIAPFVHLIHGVDSPKLLREIDKQGNRQQRVIDCLLQVHIAQEETKFGFDEKELDQLISSMASLPAQWSGIRIVGLMGMASFTGNQAIVSTEFQFLRKLFDRHANSITAMEPWKILSMGMSGDYNLAIAEGSNLVRIGSLLFGSRN